MDSWRLFFGIAFCATSYSAAAPTPSKSAGDVISVGNGTQSIPLLKSFFSYSIEFAFFPDFAGNTSQPNTFSYNLIKGLANNTKTAPIFRDGGNTQDYAIYDPNLSTATYGIIDPAKSTDYPTTLTIGPSFFQSYTTWPGVQFTHGFDLGKNSSDAHTALLQSVDPACKALSGGNFFAWELGNEPDLFRTSSQGIVRPVDWDEQDYVNEWLNLTRAIRNAVQASCPDLATDGAYKYIAPSFAGTSNSLNAPRTFADGLLNDSDISIISSHNYISGANSPGVTLQHTLMNHTSTISSIAPHVNESHYLTQYGLPYILGETNSLYNEGRPGLSNSFGAALWGFDFNLYCASQNITRVHMHQGTDYRYNAWQPIDTNRTTIGTKPPFYGQIGAAAAIGDLSDDSKPVTVETVPVPNAGDFDSAYAIYDAGQLARLAAVNLREYNYSSSSGGSPLPDPGLRGSQTYSFQLPTGAGFEGKNVSVQRLMANGSDAITGVTFNGVSFNYELQQGQPVVLTNVTTGETAAVGNDAVVSVDCPDSSAVVVFL